MSKFLRKTQFEDVIKALWDKAKDKFAKLDENNVFIGYNTFNEVILLGKNKLTETLGTLQVTDGHIIDVYTGVRTVSTHFDNPNSQDAKYISAIKVAIASNAQVGELVENVYITAVTKVTNKQDDIVGDTIVLNESFIVEDDVDYGKCIYIPIQKEYTEDTYFLIGKKGDKRLRETHYRDSSIYGEIVNKMSIDNLPSKGDELNSTEISTGWTIAHTLFIDDINVREELDSLKNKVSSVVTSVNTIQPNQDGNVTINAEHIGYDNTQTQIQANNVQGAIDKLKEDMGLLETSDIYIVQDKNGLDDLLNNQNKVKHGDLIYIINSDGVEDYTYTVVGTLNQPIAMIYDNNITGNKLRVFSRFSSSVNISANTVTYNDNTTQLNAQNVQVAIERLKEKVDDTVTSVVYNNNSNTLTVTKNGQATPYDLSSLIGVKSINGQSGTDGAITLAIDETVDTIEFKVDGQTYKTLNYMTDAQADAIINNWN